MCGLVGVVTKKQNGFSRQQQDMFTTLLFVDTFRGSDSTGAFVINNEGDIYVAKDAIYAPWFVNTNEFDELQRRAWNRGAAMIGHNRAATRGVVNDTNAHPFNVDDNIFLVHNGTMRGDHKKHADVEVDSHAIAHLIHEKDSVGEAMSAIDAAYALIWYDMQKAELNFLRNSERPLFWMELDDAWAWASEASMLEFAAARTQAKVVTSPTMLTEHMLQKFTLKNKGWSTSSEKVEIKKPVITNAFTGQRRTNVGNEWPQDEMPFEHYASGMYAGGGDDWFRNRMRRAEEWADARRDATAAQRHRAQQHPRHHTAAGTHSVIQLLPAPTVSPATNEERSGPTGVRRIMENARRMVGDREPPEFAGLAKAESTMARKLNKVIHYGHYSLVLQKYPYNASVHCAPFDYGYVNGKDKSDGFYLYATPFDDEDVIFRNFFSSKNVTEERMIQLAGCDYVFEFTLGNRAWTPFDASVLIADAGSRIDPQAGGYVIIKATAAKLISTGAQNNIPH